MGEGKGKGKGKKGKEREREKEMEFSWLMGSIGGWVLLLDITKGQCYNIGGVDDLDPKSAPGPLCRGILWLKNKI